ncbi:S8 family peptidase [Nocardioides sp. LML1-1-1.1]|uniref:S8 family peptidase n=1 Tax=Nocardioides sp. LML1-1-1.1 TaxID=3135248 RepID=UPI00343684EA
MVRIGSVVLASVLALAGQALVAPAPAPASPVPASASAGLLDVVVTLRPGTDPAAAARSLVTARGGKVTALFSSALDGFAATLTDALLATLRTDARVRSVEPERTFRASATQTPTPSWGLDRIDQRALSLNSAYGFTRMGAGVDVYVVDTGIYTRHADFAGRAVAGWDYVDHDNTPQDCNGHGTHVAGTAGAGRYGVAKRVRLIAVRVLGCDGAGDTSTLVSGLGWVVRHHRAGRPAVVNMSLGGPPSAALDAAVRSVLADGVSVVVAAGNDDADACGSSPGRVPGVLTVGASDRADARAGFSNYGSCVDLFAPGVGIASTWNDGRAKVLSGTSMAAPHVTGAVALYLQTYPSATPGAVHRAIVGGATPSRVSGTAPQCVLFLCSAGKPGGALLYVR